jgi:hypothetical protein
MRGLTIFRAVKDTLAPTAGQQLFLFFVLFVDTPSILATSETGHPDLKRKSEYRYDII